jgi:hypothetical protein
MVDTNVSIAVLVALLAVADLVLVAGLLSNRVAAVAIAVGRPVAWVGSAAGGVITSAVVGARRS